MKVYGPKPDEDIGSHRSVVSFAWVKRTLIESFRLSRMNSVEVERLDLKPLNVRATSAKRIGDNALHLSVVSAFSLDSAVGIEPQRHRAHRENRRRKKSDHIAPPPR